MIDRNAVAALVAEARCGDRDAFGSLVRQFERRVYALLMANLCDPDRAQELAQEAFVTAFQKLDALQDGAAFPEWVMGIATNLTRRRKRKGDLHADLDAAGGMPDDEDRTAVWAPLEHRERMGAVRREIEALPERYRVALMLRYFDDCSPAEIADVLGTSEGAAAMVLSRARRELGEKLKAGYPAEEW